MTARRFRVALTHRSAADRACVDAPIGITTHGRPSMNALDRVSIGNLRCGSASMRRSLLQSATVKPVNAPGVLSEHRAIACTFRHKLAGCRSSGVARASALAGVGGARDEDLVGAAGQPGHDLGDPVGGVEPWRTAASHGGCQFPADDKGKGKEISLLATFNL